MIGNILLVSKVLSFVSLGESLNVGQQKQFDIGYVSL